MSKNSDLPGGDSNDNCCNNFYKTYRLAKFIVARFKTLEIQVSLELNDAWSTVTHASCKVGRCYRS